MAEVSYLPLAAATDGRTWNRLSQTWESQRVLVTRPRSPEPFSCADAPKPFKEAFRSQGLLGNLPRREFHYLGTY